MSPEELLQSIKQRDMSGELDWGKMGEEIHNAHEMATSTAGLVLCLEMHKCLMDLAERQIKDVEAFRKFRQHDYMFLLTKEVMIGRTDGNIDPVRVAEITKREIAAGRMSSSNEVHILATAQAEEFRRSTREPSNGRKCHDFS